MKAGWRSVAVGLIVAAVLTFAFALFNLLQLPSGQYNCLSKGCPYYEQLRWAKILPFAIVGFVGGVVMMTFSAKASPRRAAAMGSLGGQLAPPPEQLMPPPPQIQTAAGQAPAPRNWMSVMSNLLVWVGLGESALAAGFLYFAFRGGEGDRSGLWITGSILGLVGVILLAVGYRAAAKARLRTTGVPGTATIVGLTQTGTWVNNNPLVGLDLAISVQGNPPYAVSVREVVPQILIGRLTNGQPLPVKVDPNEPTRVLIEWERG